MYLWEDLNSFYLSKFINATGAIGSSSVLISPDYFGQLMLAKICILVENMPTFKPPLQIQSPQAKD